MEKDILGVIATSRAGRDKGRRFAVIGVADESCVYVADGKTRRLEKPKKKKLRHLSFEKARIPLDQTLLTGDKPTADAYIRKALAEQRQDRRDCNKEG